ncbi:MAG: beta-glucuronidase [Rikenellaceae bacterium]|nr:beta-glucuronidase [Rikenellaceae bacterium]
MVKKLLLICVAVFIAAGISAQSFTDLSGEWRFQKDPEDTGTNAKWFLHKLDDVINLPGSMPEKLKADEVTLTTPWMGSIYDSSFYFNPRLEKYRQPGNIKFPFFLTPVQHYMGVAWYQKDIEITKDQRDKQLTLFLERPHIETTVWIDGKEIGMQNSLSVPHRFDLTGISAGKHTVTIRVDNRIKDIDVGMDSHSITDQTQGNWNGIVGRIELQAEDKVNFEDIQIYPDLSAKQAVVKISVNNIANAKDAKITIEAKSFNSQKKHSVSPVTANVKLERGLNKTEIILPMGNDFLTWDEFDPALYMLSATIESGKLKDRKQIQFGMREFTIDGTYFYVNGNKTVLRGTVENCTFPETGYAPMDVDSWLKVYAKCKEYGLNHVRFHSYCPPEAAFIAADLLGIYLQPEGPSWPNHGSSLGDGRPVDQYLMDETISLSKDYGNYASYVMLAVGNEPYGSRWVDWVSDFVDFWKETDTRRVYTGASVGGGWAWQPKNQFHVKAGARGLDWNRRPESYSDYLSSRFLQQSIRENAPYVSHETGQWCAFPNFNEIKKYTGVNKALNFELFKEDLADHDMGDLGYDFMMASGKLQALCYKYEIERTLRTPDYAGFQLLSLNDYSGQGSALVGVLDVFWEEKGYINAEEFRRFCNSTVLLGKFRKFVFKNSETMSAEIQVAHYGRGPIENAELVWTVKDSYGQILADGVLVNPTIPVGNDHIAGRMSVPLNSVEKADKYNLEVRIKGTEFVNDWNFWVYPELPAPAPGDVYITEDFDNTTIEKLENGENVLLLVPGKITYGKSISQRFTPVFWNTSWFKMRPPHTTGIFVNPHHPVFKDFPTDFHSDLQWWEIVNNTQVMLLTDFPEGFQPVIQSIDTWFHNRKIGVLIEANVLNGKLMVCTADLQSNPEERIVARQLLESILKYMNSDRFRPEYSVSTERVNDLFTKEEPPLETYTVQTPDELKPKIN